MLPGFENINPDLNEYELNTLLPVVVKGLSKKLGKDSAITNKAICKALKEKGFKITEVRVRKLVNHIRTNVILPGLVATSAGYYISSDPGEIERYCQSLLGRSNEILRVKKSYDDYLMRLKSA